MKTPSETEVEVNAAELLKAWAEREPERCKRVLHHGVYRIYGQLYSAKEVGAGDPDEWERQAAAAVCGVLEDAIESHQLTASISYFPLIQQWSVILKDDNRVQPYPAVQFDVTANYLGKHKRKVVALLQAYVAWLEGETS